MWEQGEGHEHNHIDGRTHVHNIHLFNRVTGGEHHLQILLGVPQCRECGRPYEQSSLGHVDPAAEINNALERLKKNHDAIMTYAGHHQVPILLGELATHVPQGHRVTVHSTFRVLHAPKAGK